MKEKNLWTQTLILSKNTFTKNAKYFSDKQKLRELCLRPMIKEMLKEVLLYTGMWQMEIEISLEK